MTILNNEVGFANFGRILGRAVRRKQRRDALTLINEEYPNLHWRSKLIWIDALMGSGVSEVKSMGKILGFRKQNYDNT